MNGTVAIAIKKIGGGGATKQKERVKKKAD